MIKERPILFSAPMVRAILDGSKTQTRRVVKPQPIMSNRCPPREGTVGALYICPDRFPTSDVVGKVVAHCESLGTYRCMGQVEFARDFCKIGQIGDRLWVREAWRAEGEVDSLPPRDLRPSYAYCFEADAVEQAGFGKLRPSIFMPRWASRITLEITAVRVERLQDISEADAVAEGMNESVRAQLGYSWEHSGEAFGLFESVGTYRLTWNKLNGPDAWDKNPWVWVIEFKRVTP